MDGASDVVRRHDALDLTIVVQEDDLGGVAEGDVGLGVAAVLGRQRRSSLRRRYDDLLGVGRSDAGML
jgi:hypothetical protein